MKVHPSHDMGKVKGEARCRRCMVAPDWPLIERKCGSNEVHTSEDTDHPRGQGISPGLLATAHGRQAKGDSLVEVASDLGIGYAQLRQKLRRHLLAQKGTAA